MNPQPAPHRQRVALWLLGAIFFLPLLVSFAMYYGSGWRPARHTNHGILIQPARPLPSVAMTAADGGVATAGVLRGKWSLVYLGGGQCDSACRATLYYMRQTHESLGSLIPRVQRVFLATAPCCDESFLQREHPGLITLNATDAASRTMLAYFPDDARANTIFIVDPRGNLMMRYDATADPKGLREDLKKLLDLSHIG